MTFVWGLACFLMACATPSSVQHWGGMALPDNAVAFGYGLAPSADCEALGQSAGAKVRQMTKGDAGILEEQTNFWLPKVGAGDPRPRPGAGTVPLLTRSLVLVASGAEYARGNDQAALGPM